MTMLLHAPSTRADGGGHAGARRWLRFDCMFNGWTSLIRKRSAQRDAYASGERWGVHGVSGASSAMISGMRIVVERDDQLSRAPTVA